MYNNSSHLFVNNKRNNKRNKSNFKLYLSILLFVLIIASVIIYEFFSYKLLVRNFTYYFDEKKFSNANNIILTTENLNPFKAILLEKDLSQYFNNKLDYLSEAISDEEISLNDALDITKEIYRYNLSSSDNTTLFTNSDNDDFNKGVSLFNSQQYAKAYDSFNKINSSDSEYKNALSYMDKCKTNIKSDLLNQVDSLSSNHYYTKALGLIEDFNYILGNDNEILDKTNEIKNSRANYLAKQNEAAQAASASIINNISTSNINELVIESLTPYLIHVDLNAQKTYIYNGKLKNWNLEKTFTCSTGIKGEETPQGVYTIKEKGQWFFSEQYNQGGKYWVQFLGDYLFHSLPYNKEKTNIVDNTLGTPASHGCIRLKDEDSKWIYDNIPKGTKVIIK
ncbi:MAG: L,D-transpeptidase [Clostridium sp.]|uniref:L,D-transpeptidase n=1 Tax=Clostridium sp. TaxID=1506 RepID=UPI0025BFEBD5|nr:L,D-transpeptidase [Clostridium sp.]MBS5926800.1 L,D-transpeptidase [Clostridium sp.]